MSRKPVITFAIVFEIIIWLLYVALYKYSYYLDQYHFPRVPNTDFPYLEMCLYSICTTLYLIPYYRWLVPKLLHRKKYLILLLSTLVWFIIINHFFNYAISWIFAQSTTELATNSFFTNAYKYWEWNLILTDFIAFFCIALARFSYQNELQKHKIETDHLHLQLNMLKAQLQPHFLFNTLNSLYGLSLTGSKDTPRFILLLSQMMQYILYDCDREQVDLKDEIDFFKGYFELEQKKFPQANISLKVPEIINGISIPPLLFLPLVENSFKHGRHKLEDNAGVEAELLITDKKIIFRIKNDMLDAAPALLSKPAGGIGLVNIRKRLELYYSDNYQLTMKNENNQYIAEVLINLK